MVQLTVGITLEEVSQFITTFYTQFSMGDGLEKIKTDSYSFDRSRHVTIERFSIGCLRTKTIVISLSNQYGRRQSKELIKSRSRNR